MGTLEQFALTTCLFYFQTNQMRRFAAECRCGRARTVHKNALASRHMTQLRAPDDRIRALNENSTRLHRWAQARVVEQAKRVEAATGLRLLCQ